MVGMPYKGVGGQPYKGVGGTPYYVDPPGTVTDLAGYPQPPAAAPSSPVLSSAHSGTKAAKVKKPKVVHPHKPSKVRWKLQADVELQPF